jgi:hypothetical protein
MNRHNVSASTQGRRRDTRTIRSRVVNLLTALTVNAAIVLSVPRSTAVDPVPMVLQRKRQLIDGRWHEGELVNGFRTSVAVVPLEQSTLQWPQTGLITDN